MADPNSERSDINLCFQALGIEFGAPPEEVEKAYQRMLAEIKRKQSSPDPAKRKEAAEDLELAHDLYEKIRNSVTYSTRMREAEQAASIKEQMKKDNKQQLQQFRVCLSCNKTIVATLKTCPFCREPVRTEFQMTMHRLFSGKGLAIVILLGLLIVGGIGFVAFKGMKSKPVEPPAAAEPAPASTPAPPAATFPNQTTAAPKP